MRSLLAPTTLFACRSDRPAAHEKEPGLCPPHTAHVLLLCSSAAAQLVELLKTSLVCGCRGPVESARSAHLSLSPPLTRMLSIGMPTSPSPPKKTNRIHPTNDMRAITNTGKESCGAKAGIGRRRYHRSITPRDKTRQTDGQTDRRTDGRRRRVERESKIRAKT